ncbi:MAG: peptidase U32 family protein [Bacilli bacterium]
MEYVITINDKKINNKWFEKCDNFLIGLKGYSLYMTNTYEKEEFEEIVKLLHLKEKKVFVKIDKLFLSHEIVELEKTLNFLSNLKIDYVIFDDMAILNLNEKYNLNLIWGSNHFVVNHKSCNVYYELGVLKSLISPEITLDEILEINTKYKGDLIVPIFGYNHMFSSKRKLLTSYYDHIGKKINNKFHTINEDRNDKMYKIYENENGTHILADFCLYDFESFKKLKTNVKYGYLDFSFFEDEEALKIFESFKKEEKLTDKRFKDGFFNTETIFKVKRK